MKEPINLAGNNGLRLFCDTVAEMFDASLTAITGQSVNASRKEVFNCDADALSSGYSDECLIIATEEKTGFDAGLLFKIRDITMLADLMLLGDGTPRNDLDDEIKDAIRELGSQLLASLNVPMEERLGKKIQFRTDDVSRNQTTALFQAEKYIAIDFTADAAGKTIEFRFYVDEEISILVEGAGGKGDDLMAEDALGFGMGGSSGGGGGGGGTSSVVQMAQGTNLDMLLDIEMPVSVRMGSARLFLKDILGLGPGNIVELDQNADEAVELSVNDKIIARGEVVIVDGYFGFRIKEIVSKAERIKKLKD